MPENTAVRPRKMQSMKKLIDKRSILQQQVDAVLAKFQPKLDRINAQIDRRIGRRKAKIRDLNTKILVGVFDLSGSEIAYLRREYPKLPEVSQGRRD